MPERGDHRGLTTRLFYTDKKSGGVTLPLFRFNASPQGAASDKKNTLKTTGANIKQVILLVAGLFAIAAPGWADVACPGDYPGHLQGIATDESGNIYWSWTTFLVKTGATGTLLAKVPVPKHYGDLTCHDGKVYVAVNFGLFNKEPGKAKSWVCVHDAETLSLLLSNAVPEAVHGAGGIEWHNGHFFVVGGLPATHTANYVYKYTESFKKINAEGTQGTSRRPFACRVVFKSGRL